MLIYYLSFINVTFSYIFQLPSSLLQILADVPREVIPTKQNVLTLGKKNNKIHNKRSHFNTLEYTDMLHIIFVHKNLQPSNSRYCKILTSACTHRLDPN